MSADSGRALVAELDLWSAAGRPVRLWLRDDDAIAPSPALDQLARLSERFELPVLLAVIPMLAEPALTAALRHAPTLLPCQHGSWHRNHAPAGGKKSEFGPGREPSQVRAEIAVARQRLGDLLGPAVLPVFVPPWNRIERSLAAALPELGFAGLSCFRDFALGPEGGPALANTHVDVMDWQGGRVGRSFSALADEICLRLAAWRRQDAGADGATLGLLLHHRDHDETAWIGLERLLAILIAHPAVRPTDPRRLFSIAARPR
jgi:hypothetical protein